MRRAEQVIEKVRKEKEQSLKRANDLIRKAKLKGDEKKLRLAKKERLENTEFRG